MGHGCGPRARRAGGCLAAPVEQTQPKFPSRGGNPLHRHRLSIDRVASRRRRYRPICFFSDRSLVAQEVRRRASAAQEQNVFDGDAGALVVHQVAGVVGNQTWRARAQHTQPALRVRVTHVLVSLSASKSAVLAGATATEVPGLLLPNAYYTSCLVVGERERCASDRLVRLTAAAKLVVNHKTTLGTRSCLQFTGLRCACSGRRNCC